MQALLFDFSRVLLFPKDRTDPRTLNERHAELSKADPDYPFFEYFELNQELLDFIHTLKDRVTPAIFTSGYIQDAPALQPFLKDFHKIYSASKLGLKKRDPAAYTWLAADLTLPPAEIVFIDDSLGNVEIAQKAGMQGIHYTGNEDVMVEINKFSQVII